MQKSAFSDEYKVLLELMRTLRKESGVTQVEIATRLDVTQSAFSKIERGELRIDVIQLREICHCINQTLPDFVQKLEAILLGKTKKRKRG